ncbi:MAG: GntR family transcriptional regulator [Peptococcia bacterium]|jgi:GntR family transcriptional regulator
MDIIISNSSADPIYEQIVQQIKKEILMGELQEGEALPSIRSLAKELQISVITTKRAYTELEREGLIETVGGKGSFVAGQNKELLREKRLSILEEKLAEVIKEAKLLQISRQELTEMLEVLSEGE